MGATAEGGPILLSMAKDVLLRAKQPAAVVAKSPCYQPVRILGTQGVRLVAKH